LYLVEHLPGWEKSKSIAGRLDNRRSNVRRLSNGTISNVRNLHGDFMRHVSNGKIV
jgi:hypothetical protein